MAAVLAIIMPILANSSGNVAFQVLSVTVRGLGVGEITPKDTLKVLRKELLAGLGTAIGLGSALAGLSLMWAPSGEHWVSFVAGAVMSVNVLIAVTLGTVLPMGFKQLNLDPALICGPLMTTTLDAIGFLTFLSLVSFALQVLP